MKKIVAIDPISKETVESTKHFLENIVQRVNYIFKVESMVVDSHEILKYYGTTGRGIPYPQIGSNEQHMSFSFSRKELGISTQSYYCGEMDYNNYTVEIEMLWASDEEMIQFFTEKYDKKLEFLKTQIEENEKQRQQQVKDAEKRERQEYLRLRKKYENRE